MNEPDHGLFPDLPFEEFKPTTTCAQCRHITAVRFSRSNLFFCAAQYSPGQFGKKIAKSAPNCEKFERGEGLIEHIDGYWGGAASEGIKRGDRP